MHLIGIEVDILDLQALAAPERLVEMVGKVRAALASDLPQAIKRMQLYLSNPATHKVLYLIALAQARRDEIESCVHHTMEFNECFQA